MAESCLLVSIPWRVFLKKILKFIPVILAQLVWVGPAGVSNL